MTPRTDETLRRGLAACAAGLVLGILAAGPARAGTTDPAAPSVTSAPSATTSEGAAVPKTTAKKSTAKASSAPMTPLHSKVVSKVSSDTTTTMTLPGGKSGTEFRSMTIEGEDRVHIDFGRPELRLDLNPEDVPGLTRGTAMDVLDRTSPDLASPMLAATSESRTPYLARPWLRQFATGSVAHFRPEVKGVTSWKLLVADSRGQTVTSYQGNGDPPKEIAWDGRTKAGAPVTPGLTYSYVFEARDRAGNKRNFVGQGFTVSACRIDGPGGPTLVMTGRDLAPAGGGMSAYGPSMTSRSGSVSPILLEVASWLNQSSKVRDPIRVAVAARTMDQATSLANRAVTALSSRVVGDPGRVQAVTEVAADAPEDGVLKIGLAK